MRYWVSSSRHGLLTSHAVVGYKKQVDRITIDIAKARRLNIDFWLSTKEGQSAFIPKSHLEEL